MKCPHCNSCDIIVQGTVGDTTNTIYRRRKCKACGKTFRTVEIIDNGSEVFHRNFRMAEKIKRLKLKKENRNE